MDCFPRILGERARPALLRSGIKIFLVLLLLSPLTIYSQEIHEKMDVELVNVYLTATDENNQFVTDLKAEDLILKEDGVIQAISSFTNFALEDSGKLGEKGVPLSVALVMDVSESMGMNIASHLKIDIVKNAALMILDELKEEDQAMLVSFDEKPSEIRKLTADKKEIKRDLLFQEVKGGKTALLDSIYYALQQLNRNFGRKIIVVCSDGEDTASSLRFDEVLSNVVASDVMVLSFGTMALNSSSLRGRYILEKLASASGGYSFFPSTIRDLPGVLEKLKRAMNSQYSIGYRPVKEGAAPGWRKIEVETRRKGLRLRFREGYHSSH